MDNYPIGSSPLARGLLGGGVERDHGARIIPARAGFTAMKRALAAEFADHPRSRGVYLLASEMHTTGPGSSPLARGLHLHGRQGRSAFGIIPARAGFTAIFFGVVIGVPDHPRSRGVYFQTSPRTVSVAGSSPLARGLPHGDWCPLRMGWGSSPLARGLHPCSSHHELFPWIIPARAGFTQNQLTSGASQMDHPRSRGVYTRLNHGYVALEGSSPLARGLPGYQSLPTFAFRIIPARAGFTVFFWRFSGL